MNEPKTHCDNCGAEIEVSETRTSDCGITLRPERVCEACDQPIKPMTESKTGFVIEARHRNKNKDLGPWTFVAAFKTRDDCYAFYGRYHQHTMARVRRTAIHICD